MTHFRPRWFYPALNIAAIVLGFAAYCVASKVRAIFRGPMWNVERDHPVLLLVYALAAVAMCALSALWPWGWAS